MLDTIKVTETRKGHRVWIQALESKGFKVGSKYTVSYGASSPTILIRFMPEGKKTLGSPSKGGVIDLVSKKVSKVMAGCATATIEIVGDLIIIEGVV